MSLFNLFEQRRINRERKELDKHKPKIIAALQRECVQNAVWDYSKAKDANARADEDATKWWMGKCIWFMILSHIKGPTGVYSGYSLDLTLPDMAERIESAKHSVLIPHMLLILHCEDAKQKSLLVFQLVRIVMSILDSSGAPVKYEVFCEVLEADEVYIWEQEQLRENSGSFLEPLGFKPHVFTEDGRTYTSWYWPREAA
jgi:hypothetical protein